MFSASCGARTAFGVLCWGPHRHDLYSWPCYNPLLQQCHTPSEGTVASPSGQRPSPAVRAVFWAYLLVPPRVHGWTTGPGLLRAIPRVLGHCLERRKKGESRLMADCIHRVVKYAAGFGLCRFTSLVLNYLFCKMKTIGPPLCTLGYCEASVRARVRSSLHPVNLSGYHDPLLPDTRHTLAHAHRPSGNWSSDRIYLECITEFIHRSTWSDEMEKVFFFLGSDVLGFHPEELRDSTPNTISL